MVPQQPRYCVVASVGSTATRALTAIDHCHGTHVSVAMQVTSECKAGLNAIEWPTLNCIKHVFDLPRRGQSAVAAYAPVAPVQDHHQMISVPGSIRLEVSGEVLRVRASSSTDLILCTHSSVMTD